MKRINFAKFSKRQKLVLLVFSLSAAVFFAAQFLHGIPLLAAALFLGGCTTLGLYMVLKKDIQGTFYYPIFILPFFFTFSFLLFYTVVPARLISRIVLTAVYMFGLYSLFLTQNIFAVSGIRTITLLRSARIVSFVLTIFIFFFLINFIFSLRAPIYITPLVVGISACVLNFQSLWTYSLEKEQIREIAVYSLAISVALSELALILTIWPVNAAIYSIFLIGIYYTYSGLSHAWIEKRLFKGVLVEYVWVAFLSVLILLLFSKWGA